MDFFSSLITYKSIKENTSKGLKSLISSIDSEKNVDKLYTKINQVEVFLDGMSQMKCDINYQKLFPNLFKKINTLPNIEIRTNSYIHIYLQLNRIFPEISPFLKEKNKNSHIIEDIHKIENYKIKNSYYSLYTNYFSNCHQLSSKDLIKIYNCILCNVIIKICDLTLSSIQIFTNIVIEIYNKFQ